MPPSAGRLELPSLRPTSVYELPAGSPHNSQSVRQIFPEFLVADQLLGQMFPDRHGRPNAVALVLRVALTEQQPAVFKKRENLPRDGSIARSLSQLTPTPSALTPFTGSPSDTTNLSTLAPVRRDLSGTRRALPARLGELPRLSDNLPSSSPTPTSRLVRKLRVKFASTPRSHPVELVLLADEGPLALWHGLSTTATTFHEADHTASQAAVD